MLADLLARKMYTVLGCEGTANVKRGRKGRVVVSIKVGARARVRVRMRAEMRARAGVRVRVTGEIRVTAIRMNGRECFNNTTTRWKRTEMNPAA
jgi:hypothetical protein